MCEVLDQVPEPADYVRLRAAAGLSDKSMTAATLGLPNSWAGAIVRTAAGQVVGMGRLIGDPAGQALYVRHGFVDVAPSLGMMWRRER